VLCISFFVYDLFVVGYEQQFVLLQKCSTQMSFILSFFITGDAMEFQSWLWWTIIMSRTLFDISCLCFGKGKDFCILILVVMFLELGRFALCLGGVWEEYLMLGTYFFNMKHTFLPPCMHFSRMKINHF
jgi:hypothetical protein